MRHTLFLLGMVVVYSLTTCQLAYSIDAGIKFYSLEQVQEDPTLEEILYEHVEDRKQYLKQFISGGLAASLVDSMEQDLISPDELAVRLIDLSQTTIEIEYNLLKDKLSTYDYEIDSLDFSNVISAIVNQNSNGYQYFDSLPCTEIAAGMVEGALIVASVGLALSGITKGVSAIIGTMVSAGVLLSAQDAYCNCMNDRYGTGGPECGGIN